jgi:hypothetical protein
MNANKQKGNESKLDIKKKRIKINTQKITENNDLIKRILVYSAKKINAKPPPPNSTLKPKTSSDKPSAKSKEV